MSITRRTLLAGTAALPLAASAQTVSAQSASAQTASGVGRETMNDAHTVKTLIIELVEKYPDGVAPIVSLGDPVLRQVAEPFDGQVDDKVLTDFIALMRRTMKAAPA